jgi:L-lactate dehydrogenase (cytochrome)
MRSQPHRPHCLHDCHSIADLRELARRQLPAAVFEYLDGGAETEWTARRNTTAFDEASLIPNVLADVATVRTETKLLGQSLSWPVFLSPTGASRLYHPDGELAVARAAARSGTLYGLSVAATQNLEAVGAQGAGPRFFQLLGFKDPGLTRALIERCRAAGYPALCLTVDAAVRGKRERELRAGMGIPPRLSWSTAAQGLTRPAWFLGQARRGPLRMHHLDTDDATGELIAGARQLSAQMDTSFSWAATETLIRLWNGPFALKGILSVKDARQAVAIGATALIVSNHGGRQLDGAAAPFDVLPEIASAVGDQIEIILDGGIRRGTHVLKALARGAKACSIGRPYLYGLGAGGEAGVAKAIDILRSEFVLAMQLCGRTEASAIDADLLRCTSG